MNAKVNSGIAVSIFTSDLPYRELMAKYGVSRGCIGDIKTRRSWTNATEKEKRGSVKIEISRRVEKKNKKECLYCGNGFVKKISSKYCSHKCFVLDWQKKGLYKKLCKKLPEKILCAGCKCEFKPLRALAKYCSRRCFSSHTHPHPNFLEASRKLDHKGISGRAMKKRWAENRGAMLNVNKNRKRSESTKAKLSAIAKQQWINGQFDNDVKTRRKNLPRGEGHFNYKNGSGNIRMKLFSLLEYKQWRTSVFKRDNYTCQKCGKRGNGDLEAHHKVSFREIHKKYGFKDHIEAAKCVELFDINNGVTLCVNCHSEVDFFRKRLIKKNA